MLVVPLVLGLSACAHKETPPPYLGSRLLPPLRVPDDLSRPRTRADVSGLEVDSQQGVSPSPSELEIPPGLKDSGSK